MAIDDGAPRVTRGRERRSLRAAAAALVLALTLAVSGPARAGGDDDDSARLPLPDWDLAIGVTGGVAFDELDSARHTGGLVGVDVGLLNGVLGLHLGLRASREGEAWRVGGLTEVSVWYVLLLGVGCRFGAMLADGGPGVPDGELGLTLLVGLPLPIARLDEGRAGALVLVPYARPGFRFLSADSVAGFHELGVMLRWTSFGF